MIDDITIQINKTLDNSLDNYAIKNIIQAKLCGLFSFKGLTFNSGLNLKKAYPLNYYAMHFATSGASKTVLLSEINNTLFTFFDKIEEDYHKKRHEWLKDRQDEIMRDYEDAKEKEGNKLLAEFKKEKSNLDADFFMHEIPMKTQADMYNILKVIDNLKHGSVFIKNTEFPLVFSDAIIGKDKTKKDFMDMMYELYDGAFFPISAASSKRKNLEKISVSCAFMGDFHTILSDEKLFSEFKNYLKRGLARRTFLYFKSKKDIDYSKEDVLVPISEKEKAYGILNQYAVKIESIYNKLEMNQHFSFDEKANELLYSFKIQCKKRAREFERFVDNIDLNTSILQVNIEGAPWKITKLAVVYHILNSNLLNIVSPYIERESVQKAIDFFEESHLFLVDLLNANTVSDYEQLYSYLVANLNTWKSLTILRNQNFINKNIFSNWIKNEAIPLMPTFAQKKNLKFVYRNTSNTGIDLCVYDPQTHEFRVTEHDPNKKIIKGELVDLSKTGRIEVTEI